jgi:hypothetical protein
VTETEKLADNLAAARPVLDDLQHMVVKASDVGADWVSVHNPSHWRLPTANFTVEYYRVRKCF